MLDPKNAPFGDASKTESEVNKEKSSPHTMRDDLDVLSGKIAEKKGAGSGNVQSDTAESKSESEIRNAADNPFTGNIPRQTQANVFPETNAHKPETEKIQDFKIDRSVKKEKEKAPPKSSSAKSLKWNKIIILILFVVVIFVLAAGGYYFWITRSSVEPVVQPQPAELPKEPVINVPSERFSTENPNYLNIEVENVAVDNITQLLTQTVSEVEESKIKVPIEFLIADGNNNPIAFSRFAYLFQLNLSSETLSSLDEEFSLYLYNDSGNIRLGMTVDFKDKEKTAAGMAEGEGVLVENLSNLFIGASAEKENILFSDGEYKNYSIRYVNLDEQETISVDYAFTGNHLVIGTSKNTIRATLDKAEDDGESLENISDSSAENNEEIPENADDIGAEILE